MPYALGPMAAEAMATLASAGCRHRVTVAPRLPAASCSGAATVGLSPPASHATTQASTLAVLLAVQLALVLLCTGSVSD